MSKTLVIEVSNDAKMQAPQSNRVSGLGGAAAKAIGDLIEVSTDDFVKKVSEIVEDLGRACRPKEGGPHSCEATIAIKLGVEGNIWLAKVGSESTLEIKLVWNRES